jgi:hypothetical protein
MNLFITITKWLPGMFDQGCLRHYAELCTCKQRTTLLKGVFKSLARILPDFNCDEFSQKDVRMLCEQ